MEDFGNTAKSLSKSPLGVLSLFLVLVYALACAVFNFKSGLSETQNEVFLCFIVFFPIFIFVAFMWVWVYHSDKLFAPSDFSDENNFIKLRQRIDHTVNEKINSRINELEKQLEYEVAYLRLSAAKLQGRYDVALYWANRQLEKGNDSELLTQKAFCLWSISKDGRALEAIDEALKVNNFNTDQNKATAYFNRACFLGHLGRNEDLVIGSLEQAIRIDKKYVEMMKNDVDLSSVNIECLLKKYNK